MIETLKIGSKVRFTEESKRLAPEPFADLTIGVIKNILVDTEFIGHKFIGLTVLYRVKDISGKIVVANQYEVRRRNDLS